jgi:small subunit ribosomal protein S6
LRHFEIVAILSPMLNQDEASATWDDIKSFISNREGEITAEQVWGTRRLAYPIRKGNYNFLEGAYYLSSFTVDNAFNRELENYLRLDDRVLRSLITRCDGPLPDRPAPGPLTAPSRYIPPGRGRRSDGGGPVQDASPGGFGDRAPQPAPTGVAPAPAADAPAPSGDVAAAPATGCYPALTGSRCARSLRRRCCRPRAGSRCARSLRRSCTRPRAGSRSHSNIRTRRRVDAGGIPRRCRDPSGS